MLFCVGVGLFRTASFINHSCTPNALALFSGSEIVIRATKNIQPGEEITISYIEILQTTKERHNELQERYFFQCQCERCCNEETFGVDGLMDSYKCQNLDCDVPFVFDMSKGMFYIQQNFSHFCCFTWICFLDFSILYLITGCDGHC